MRAVVQRVRSASVLVDTERVGSIGVGICAFVGIGVGDTEADALFLADKLVELRIFEDDQQKMNRSVLDVGGEVLLVSQFTLYGDARRGRRPSFTLAMEPVMAESLIHCVTRRVRDRGLTVATGRFRADMQVHLVNDGSVTLLLDTSKLF